MISILKTFLFLGVFLIHLSSSSVIPKRDQSSASNYHQDQNTASTSRQLAISTTTNIISDDLDDSCEADEPENSGTTGPNGSNPTPVDSPSSTLSTVVSTSVPTKTAQPHAAPVAPGEPDTPVLPKPTSPSTPASTPTPPNPVTAPAAGKFWEPAAGSTWQIELSGIVTDTSYPADVFDLDLVDTPQSTIDALHAAGKKVICYFSAGSFENWRPDQAKFTAADKGLAMEGWAGEWWLNTKTANVRSIMAARIDLAASKGCDAVDPDNVDGYNNANGVGLTSADGADFLNFLADKAHSKGLSIGLKNAGALISSVLDKMQFHVNEQCIEFDECELFKPFIDAGKPVYHIEYPTNAPTIASDLKIEKCVAAKTMSFSTVLKTEALNAWVETC
ncbi:hypothetical protein WAI453_002103 [Rhynchosporium graminicola]|uniref:alpha-galactosidase n=1 Tax=Rhynchosporium graminicola TaxID=2792576 RepID=A0A1E1KWJ0_9HELO|nr:related to endo alpha-1,4 polygalactosaminidase [Rhynchosporium commune]